MSIVNLSWIRCLDCKEVSTHFSVQSFSTSAPPPKDLNYELLCQKCGSADVESLSKAE